MQCVHPANAISKSLTALREFVYNSTEDASPTVNIPISEMKKAIAAKRITIVGGNENWVKKLRQEFPNWKFVSASVSSTVDNMSVLTRQNGLSSLRIHLATAIIINSCKQSNPTIFLSAFCMALILSGTSFKSMTIYLKKDRNNCKNAFSALCLNFDLKKLLL